MKKLVRSWRVLGNTLLVELVGGVRARGPIMDVLTTLTYGPVIQIDASLGTHCVVSITDAVAFSFAAPLNPPPAGMTQDIWVTARNVSGGAHGAGAWNAVFKAPAFPAIANNNQRTFAFRWDGANWVQFLSPATDVPV